MQEVKGGVSLIRVTISVLTVHHNAKSFMCVVCEEEEERKKKKKQEEQK